jgi:hypothetical protein
MTAPTRSGSVGVVVAAFLTIVLVACEAERPAAVEPSAPETSPTVSAPATPSFRFALSRREVVRTARGGLSKRDRRIAQEAARSVRSLITDLYAGAFLAPDAWGTGDYDDVFAIFAGQARQEAQRRTGTLTAGEDAAQRFDSIEPVVGRLKLEILLDRGGKPAIVSTAVTFRARGSGAEPTLLRSDGSYLFRRIDGAWRIVSFDVARADREQGTT